MDLNQIILEKIKSELKNKEFGVTEQLLEIHEIETVDGNPTILRIDNEKPDGTVIAYLKVKDESFSLAVYFDTIPEIQIKWIGTEAENIVYFRAQSESLDAQKLANMIKIKPTRVLNRGEAGKSRRINKGSAIMIEPNPEPDEFEDKLAKLLDLLEEDEEGVRTLVNQADAYIQAAITFHNGNTMLGGPDLNASAIKRLSRLGLSINFDLYAIAEFYKSPLINRK